MSIYSLILNIKRIDVCLSISIFSMCKRGKILLEYTCNSSLLNQQAALSAFR